MPDSLEPFRPTWGNASKHDPERYEAHLCESCLFRTLRVLYGERMVNTMFDSGLEVQKSYQKSMEQIFDSYLSASSPAGEEPPQGGYDKPAN